MVTDSAARTASAPAAAPTISMSAGVPPTVVRERAGRGPLDASTAAALPNVAEYLRHMEQHQRAYAMLNKTKPGAAIPQQQRDAASMRALMGVPHPSNEWLPAHANLALGATPHVPAAFEASAHASSGLWADMMNGCMPMSSMPAASTPRVPTAPQATVGLAAPNASTGALPFAHAMPMALPTQAPNALASPMPTGAPGAPPVSGPLGCPAAMKSALQGVLNGGLAGGNAGSQPVPTDAASLSMHYAALSSHFAQVAQTPAVPPRPALPFGTPTNTALPTHGFSAPPPSFVQGMPMDAPKLPLWWPQGQEPVPVPNANYLAACHANPTAPNHLMGVPDSLKRRADANLRGGCAMARGMDTFANLPSAFTHPNPMGLSMPTADAQGDAAAVCAVSAPLELRASKQPRRAATSLQTMLDVNNPQQLYLAQNLADACGASTTTEMVEGGMPISRQMSDEEVFSMFADELQEVEVAHELPSCGFDGGLMAQRSRFGGA